MNLNKKIKFSLQDVLKIKEKYDFDLVFSVHTFCVFKNIENQLKIFQI